MYLYGTFITKQLYLHGDVLRNDFFCVKMMEMDYGPLSLPPDTHLHH